MPPILFKDLLVEIRHSLGRYLSILAIVALGVSFFAGIKASAPDMKNSADTYFDRYHLQDIQLFSTIGITKGDLDALKDVEGVEDVQGQFSADFLSKKDNREMTVKVISFAPDQPLNQPRLMEGRLPDKDNECLIQADSATDKIFGTYEVGEKITLYSGSETPIDEELKASTFTITGKAFNPNYLSYELGSSSVGSGKVDTFVYVLQDCIKADYYTEADLAVAGARDLDTYSDAYFDAVDPVLSRVEALADSQIKLDLEERLASIDKTQKEADEKLADGAKKLAEAKDRLDAGNKELADKEKELKDGKAKLEAGKKELAANKTKLEDGAKQVKDGLNQISLAKVQIEAGQAQLPTLQSQKQQLSLAIAAVQGLEALKSTLISTQNSLADLQARIDEAQSSGEMRPELPGLLSQEAILQSTLDSLMAQIGQSAGTPIDTALAQIDGQEDELLKELGGSLEAAQDLQAQLDAGIAQIQQGTASLVELEKTRQDLEAKKEEIEAGQKQLEAGQKEIEASEKQIADGEKQIVDAKKELASGQQEYDKNKKDFDKQSAEAAERFDDARKQLTGNEPEWIVLDRNSHYSYRDYESCADRMDGIASVFPVFFFLVAALVCMTTMTRMVDEERNEMGTLKALGYSRMQVSMKYLLYASSASILGSIVGCAVGMLVFPMIIYSAWNIMYNLESIQFKFQPGLMLAASLMVTGVVLLATWFSIAREMREVPAQLMRPKAAKAGQRILLERIGWFWSKLSFMHKVTLRNLFRYKKRFFMTVIGIAGCSALLLAGFGLNDSISDIVPRQFESVYHFNATVSADTEDGKALAGTIRDLDGVSDSFDLQVLPVTVHYDGKDVSAELNIVSDPKAFEPFMTFYPMERGSADSLSDEGALLSVKTAEKLGVHTGDTMQFKTTDNKEISIKVAGIFEQYTGHQIYVTEKLFKTLGISEKPDVSILLVNDKTDADFESRLGSRLMEQDGVRSVTFYSATIDNFLNMISSIKMVVVVLVLSAAMLAFVVLYNLSNVNISERMREIATIKVLGFTEKEVNAYVNRETVILALIGSIAGLFLGIYLHDLIMNLAELDTVRFGRTIFWQSYAYSIALTMLFTLIVNWIMKFRLKKIQMVESLKAVE